MSLKALQGAAKAWKIENNAKAKGDLELSKVARDLKNKILKENKRVG